MAETVKNIIDDIEDEFLDPLDKAEYEEEQRVREAIVEYSGDKKAKIWIYRLSGPNPSGKTGGEFIECFFINDYSYEEIMLRLRDEYLGGDFKIQIRDSKGHVRSNEKVSIIKKLPTKEEDKSNSDIAAMIATMNESSRQSAENTQNNFQTMMLQMMDAQRQSSENNMQMLVKMMEIQNNKPEKESLGIEQIVTIAASVKELFGSKTDPTEILLKGMEFGKETASGGDENMLQTAMKTLGPGFTAMTNALAGQPGQAAPMPLPNPAIPQTPHGVLIPPSPAHFQQIPETYPPSDPLNSPTAPIGQPEQPEQPTEQAPVNEEEQEMLQIMGFLQQQGPMLIQMAAKNADHETYANFLLDALGDELARKYILDDEKYGMLFTAMPNLAQYRNWFDAVRSIVIEFITNDSEQPVAPHENDLPPNPVTSNATGAESPTEKTDTDVTTAHESTVRESPETAPTPE